VGLLKVAAFGVFLQPKLFDPPRNFFVQRAGITPAFY
jgi:hypothetical protein